MAETEPTPRPYARTRQQWAGMVPAAVMGGSQAQAIYCLTDAQRDIAALHDQVGALRSVEVALLNREQTLLVALRACAKQLNSREGTGEFSEADLAASELAAAALQEARNG
jgi:hypothetical protein